MKNIRPFVVNFLSFFLPIIYFGVSFRFPNFLIAGAILYFLALIFLMKGKLTQIPSSVRTPFFLIGLSFSVYGLFKAFSFDSLSYFIDTILYYVLFVCAGYAAIFLGAINSKKSILWGMVFAALSVQFLYLNGVLNWNQYQLVGNVTFLGVLASYVLRHYLLSVLLTYLVILTPSTQSQGLVLMFLLYWVYRGLLYDGASFAKTCLVRLVFVTGSVVACLYIVAGVGDDFYTNTFLQSRQFDFDTRIADRLLIFFDHFSVINPLIPVSQSELNFGARFGSTSFENKVHGIWLAYLVYMGFVFGAVFLTLKFYSMLKIFRSDLLLLPICLVPWAVSSEVNPIKYTLVALVICFVIVSRSADDWRLMFRD